MDGSDGSSSSINSCIFASSQHPPPPSFIHTHSLHDSLWFQNPPFHQDVTSTTKPSWLDPSSLPAVTCPTYYKSELEVYEIPEHVSYCYGNNRRKRMRRLSSDQVRLLEANFEAETTLHPDKKLRLASELGLEARQVAIWFQNKRVRFKTKQLEMDFEELKWKYERLKSEYSEMLQEKQRLIDQVSILTTKLNQTNKLDKDHGSVVNSPDSVLNSLKPNHHAAAATYSDKTDVTETPPPSFNGEYPHTTSTNFSNYPAKSDDHHRSEFSQLYDNNNNNDHFNNILVVPPLLSGGYGFDLLSGTQTIDEAHYQQQQQQPLFPSPPQDWAWLY